MQTFESVMGEKGGKYCLNFTRALQSFKVFTHE